MSTNPLSLLRHFMHARRSSRYARARGAMGMEFDRFGRQMGRRLLCRGWRGGVSYLLAPVSSLRYFEFPFVWSCLPKRLDQCADVSSPRLFTFYVASHHPRSNILLLNPDAGDANASRAVASRLTDNVDVRSAAADALADRPGQFDCIWSISVIEHISGPYDERQAVRWMFQALRPGGRLIVTVPVDRTYYDEKRNADPYGTQERTDSGEYFFQRVYDRAAVWERIVAAAGVEPGAVRWYGEREAGSFREYERRWISQGYRCSVNDPREFADHYGEFDAWEHMPGFGVCGLMFEKPS